VRGPWQDRLQAHPPEAETVTSMLSTPTSLITTLIAVTFVSAVPLSAITSQAPAAAVATARASTDTRLGMTVVATEVELPMGHWEVAAVTPLTALDQVFVVSHLTPEDLLGRRGFAAEMRQAAASVQLRLQFLYDPIAQYAATHNGVGPKSLNELDRQMAPFLDDIIYSPWPQDADKRPLPPYLFLVPATRVSPPPGARGAGPVARTPLLLELRPFEDDGRHWVLFANGDLERVPIDRALVAKHKLVITAVEPAGAAPRAANGRVVHTLLGLRRGAATTVTVTLADTTSSERRDLRWSLAGGKIDPSLLREWADARARQWYPLVTQTQSPILQTWIDRTGAIYGGGAVDRGRRGPRMMGPVGDPMEPRSTSAFDLLGGRAALRETLQMELLRGGDTAPGRFSAAAAAVTVASLKGVDVEAVPFERLLAGRPGGRLALADFVPEDRLFVYFAKPAAVFPFLTQGGDMIGRAGSTITATAFDDDLKRRYLRRLGLPEEGSRKLLESGAITELALTAPDLFFIDGTDLTVLMRVAAPDTAVVALGMLAGVNLSGSAIAETRTPAGRPAYWARQGDVLALSTSRREIEQALRHGQSGEGSLGRSAELRYMLAELPLRPESRAFIYLSDPFIRRMVGPAVKIGQLRRMRAAADMAIITAGAMLYRLDGHRDPPDLATLARLNYVPARVARPDYRVQPDLSVVSQTWGTLAELAPIAPIDTVTQEEAAAYKLYVDEYRRYWRQYFDPIAMRLDDAPGGALELSTFILPLVDSALYNQLRGVIGTRETGRPLRVPRTTPAPVMQFSLNLSDDTWVALSSGFGDFFSQYTGIPPELLDLLGPGLHIAVQDADPVISLGTSDLLGAFGASTLGVRMDMGIPFVLSLLTRPCKIFIELEDAPRALALMRRAASAGDRPGHDLDVAFRQVGNRDAWTYTFAVPGLARFRLGVEIQNGYLVLSNIPWSDAMVIDGVETRALNGAAIAVRPDAVQLGLAGLFATQAEQDQTAALASLAALLPLLQTGAATPAEASARHAALFGSIPRHPGTGEWVWANGRLESQEYGSATRWKAPSFDPTRSDFGLFNGATLLDLSMQLEQGGLRATARWLWKEPAGPRR
jgi:hypothetical protein